MKLGLFDHMQKHDEPARSYVDLYKSHLEVFEFADQAGMDFYFVAEHHFDMGFSECPSPGTFLGAASQRTKKIRLGPLVYVLPLWNPIRVAEEVALLDNLTEGRLECGFGAGIGPFSFAAYNISLGSETRDDAGSAAHYQRASGPTSRSASKAATSSAKTSTCPSRSCKNPIRRCGCRRAAKTPSKKRRRPA